MNLELRNQGVDISKVGLACSTVHYI